MDKSENVHTSGDVSESLRAAGLQVTAQRLAVYRAVESLPHAIADEIYKSVRTEPVSYTHLTLPTNREV